MQQADLKERERGTLFAELVIEFRDQGSQETRVDEQLRIIHQRRVRAESEGGQHLERTGQLGLSGGFLRGAQVLTFDV
jgi:hypothetical protein